MAPPKSDEAYGLLDVASFLKRLRANSGTDVKGLVRDWANSLAVPRFECGYRYDPRKHQVEFVVKQDLSRGGVRKSGRTDTAHPFTGSLTVRITELEGVQHDHIIDIRDEVTSPFAFPQNSLRTACSEVEPFYSFTFSSSVHTPTTDARDGIALSFTAIEAQERCTGRERVQRRSVG